MSVDERVAGVIQVLYDAALDEAIWPKALQELVDLTGSLGASFWTLESSEQPRLPVFTTFNFDDRFIRAYLESMVPLDPTVQYLVHHPDEPIVHDGIVITERDKGFHPYYDWQSRQSDIHFRMVCQTRPTPTVQAGVALHRTQKMGRYEPEDLKRFALIYGHLQRALAIGIRLGSLGATQRVSLAGGGGIYLTDDGHVLSSAELAALSPNVPPQSRSFPPERSGLKPGDAIVAVNGVVTKTRSEIVPHLIGKPGQQVTVRIRRENMEQDVIMSFTPWLECDGDIFYDQKFLFHFEYADNIVPGRR